jgi:arylsulfatase A
VAEDIGSVNDVADEHPDVVARLELLAEKARADLGDLNLPGRGQRQRGYVSNPQPQVLRSSQ